MAEIDFFATESEKLEIVQHLFDEGCRFIPDLHFNQPKAPEILRPDDLLRYVQLTSQFFIVKDDLLQSPLEFRRVERERESFYYISPRVGGPILLLFWGKHYRKDDNVVFGATTLSYYPWYENSITRERVRLPQALVELYNETARRVRERSRKIKPGVRTYWVTPAVESLVRNGAILIGLEAFSPDRILADSYSERSRSRGKSTGREGLGQGEGS